MTDLLARGAGLAEAEVLVIDPVARRVASSTGPLTGDAGRGRPGGARLNDGGWRTPTILIGDPDRPDTILRAPSDDEVLSTLGLA